MILRTVLLLVMALLVSASHLHATEGMGAGLGGGYSGSYGGGYSGPVAIPQIQPQVFQKPYEPPFETRRWLPSPMTSIGLIGVAKALEGREPRPPPPPAMPLPPPPPVVKGPSVWERTRPDRQRAKELGKKAASSLARHGASFMGKAVAGAGALRASLREAREETPPEPRRQPKKARRRSNPPAAQPSPPASEKLDPRLMSIPDEQMVMVMIRGESRGLTAEARRAALSSSAIAPGNERSHLLRVEATQNLTRVLQAIRKEQLAHPGDIPGYELNWLLNGVVVMARARLARSLSALGDVNYVLLDAPVTLATPKSRRLAPAGQSNWGVAKISAPQAWQEFGAYGQGVTIGLVDTGVDGQHKDLVGRILRFRDFTKAGAPDGPAFDDEGHGTHCAGIIAGGSAQGSPIGVAPKAQLLVAKALDKNGSGSIAGLVQALQWMADPDGNPATRDQPTAVSISWGSDPGLPVANTIFWDAISSLRAAGVLPIVASGNAGLDSVAIPGAYPHIYSVGATDPKDQVADITSRGNVTWQGVAYTKPNISAPGDEVYSATPGNKYEWMTGTSQAAPHVAGVAALMKSVNPVLTGPQIQEIINRSASDLGAPGADATFGSGRLDARAAVAEAKKLGNADGNPAAAVPAAAQPVSKAP